MLVPHGARQSPRKGRGWACEAHLKQPGDGDGEAAAGMPPSCLGGWRLSASGPVLRAGEVPGLTQRPQEMPLVAGPRATFSLESGGPLEAGRLLPSTYQAGVQTAEPSAPTARARWSAGLTARQAPPSELGRVTRMQEGWGGRSMGSAVRWFWVQIPSVPSW